MLDPQTIATITCKGQVYSAWESVMVRRDYSNGISIFQFTPTEGSYGTNFANLKLQPGDAVTIALGGQLVITGNVTTRNVAYDAKSHQVVVSGKSYTKKLHSSVQVQPGSFNGNTFEQAARSVMQPYGVTLSLVNPPAIASKPFANLAVQYGESVAEFVTRMANVRGLFITDDANGNLVAGQGANGAPVAELYEGRNILRATGSLDDQNAWGTLGAATQQAGSDENWPPRAIAAQTTNPYATDQSSYKLFIGEHPGDAQDLAQRVNFEQVRDSWPIVHVTITVAGWFKPDGTLWDVTDNISVYSPMIFPTQTGLFTLGVQSCTYSQDSENGTTTTMEMVLPNLLTTKPGGDISDLGGGDPKAATPVPPDTSGSGTPAPGAIST